MPSTFVMPTAYPANEYSQVPPMVGGTTAMFSKAFVFGDTDAITIASLPSGSKIVDVAVHLVTAFDSATTAVFSLGTTGATTAYVNAFNLKGTAGTTRSNSASGSTVPITNLFTALDSPSDIVATITKVGATAAGAVTLVFWYTTGS